MTTAPPTDLLVQINSRYIGSARKFGRQWLAFDAAGNQIGFYDSDWKASEAITCVDIERGHPPPRPN